MSHIVDHHRGHAPIDEVPRAPAPIADRPVGVVDLIDGAFAALRQRPRTFAVVAVVFVVPAALLEGWLARNSLGGVTFDDLVSDPSLAADSGVSPFGTEALVSYLIEWLVVAVTGVGVATVVGGWLDGVDVGPADALRRIGRRWLAILVVFLVGHVLQAVAVLGFVIGTLVVVTFLSLASPVLALEDLGPFESMQRSASLVRRAFGKVLGVVVLTAVVSLVVTTAIGVIPSLGASVVGEDRAWPLVSVASAVSSIVLVPFTGAAMTLTYLDLRFRTEGLDLEIRARRRFPTGVASDG